MRPRALWCTILLVGGYLGYQLAAGMFDLLTGRAVVAEMLVGTLLLSV